MQLCQEAASSQRHRPAEAEAQIRRTDIWRIVRRDEVCALGSIVGQWAQGSLSPASARWHMQVRVLRGLSPDDYIAQSARAPVGLTPHPIFQAMPPGTRPEDFGAANHFLTALENVFSGFSLALTVQQPPGPSPEPAHEVFSTIDSVFFSRTFEAAYLLAMRGLDLDGPRPMSEEVGASFRLRADPILESQAALAAGGAPNSGLADTAIWLDMVKLCLFVEVLRHVKRSSPGGPALDTGSLYLTEWRDSGLGTRAAGQIVSGNGPPQAAGRGAISFRNMPMITRLDPAAGSLSHGAVINREQLRDRVGALLELLLMVDTGQRLDVPAGLSEQALQQHCPVQLRTAGHEECCPICLEPAVVGEPVRALPCGHSLHKECVEAWLANANTCPTCRFEISRT